MRKVKLLRQWLQQHIDFVRLNPDRLLTFVDSGAVEHRPGTQNFSHTQAYTATITLIEYSGDVATLMVPILVFMERFENWRPAEQAITYSAEIINNDAYDIEIKLQLTEHVVVQQLPDGRLSATTADEVVYQGHLPIDTTLDPLEYAPAPVDECGS